MQGPELFLNANAVQNIGFALHELATNASKHGALSTPAGRVTGELAVSPTDDRIQVEWLERNGPSVHPPDRQGLVTWC